MNRLWTSNLFTLLRHFKKFKFLLQAHSKSFQKTANDEIKKCVSQFTNLIYSFYIFMAIIVFLDLDNLLKRVRLLNVFAHGYFYKLLIREISCPISINNSSNITSYCFHLCCYNLMMQNHYNCRLKKEDSARKHVYD